MEDLSGGVLSLDHRYEVLHPRGYNGLARCYRGVQQPFNLPVDVWVMDVFDRLQIPSVPASAIARRLELQVRDASQLRSPHALKILDYGEVDENVPFVLTEAVKGACLSDIIQHQGRLPLEGTIKVIEEVALALEDVHANNFGHLGVRPEHIWFEQTPSGAYARLGGFGCTLLKHEIGLIDASADLEGLRVDHLAPESFDTEDVRAWRRSLTGSFKPGFDGDWTEQPPPEESVGTSPTPVDPVAFDMFGLAITAWRCLTGCHPFIDDLDAPPAEQFKALSAGDLLDLADSGVALPDAVLRVLKGGLALDPGARPDSALAFARALAEAAREDEAPEPEAPESFESLDLSSEERELPTRGVDFFEDTPKLGAELGWDESLLEHKPVRYLVAGIALLFFVNLGLLMMMAFGAERSVPVLSIDPEAAWSKIDAEGLPEPLEVAPTAVDLSTEGTWLIESPGESPIQIKTSPEGLIIGHPPIDGQAQAEPFDG